MGIGIAPNGAVYVADTLNNRVVKLTAGAGATNIAWGGSFTAAGQLKAPQGVDADAAGRIYVADTGHSQLVALSGTGAVLATASGFNSPANVAVRDSDGRVVVADTYNDRLQVYRWQ
jgi:serine/threonine-protein kinase